MRYAVAPNCRPALGQTAQPDLSTQIFAVNPNDPDCLVRCRDKYCGALFSACYGNPPLPDPADGPTWCERFAACYYGPSPQGQSNCNDSCTGPNRRASVSFFSPFGG